VNVALAVLLFAVVTPAGALATWHEARWVSGGDFLSRLMWINVSLAVFNLIPAFPMDGGRALRAILAMRMDYVRATHIAAQIGQGLALMFGLIGLFSNPLLVFIALFVWMGAAAEASTTQMRSALSGIPVSRMMIERFETLAPTDPLQRAVSHVLAGFQQDFPVIEAGQVVGVLTRSDLMSGLAQKGPEASVAEVMNRRFETVSPSDMLDGAVQRLQSSGCPALPVLRGSELVGVLTLENVGEFLMIHAALDKTRRAEVKPARVGSFGGDSSR
jgi:predicted transcriptional regulator